MSTHLSQNTSLPTGVTFAQITHFAAGAVILNDRQQMLMMLRDDYPVWTTIGGMVEPNETFEQALHREIREETNLSVFIDHVRGDYFSPVSNKNGLYFKHERMFVCHPSPFSEEMKLRDEGVCLRWINPNNLPPNTPPKYRQRIKEALDNALPTTSFLMMPHMREFALTLHAHDIDGLDMWRAHPRVQARKRAGLLADEVKRYLD